MADAVFELLSLQTKVLFPFVGESLNLFVVSTKTMDPSFNVDKSELCIFVFSTFLQMSLDVDGFLDQAVKILRDLRSTS